VSGVSVSEELSEDSSQDSSQDLSERQAFGVVNKITWQKAGRVTQPGRYMFTFGWLTVTAEDLRVWERFPDAAFTLVRLPQRSLEGSAQDNNPDGELVAEEFHLGAFEIPLHDTPPAAHDSHGEA
jgi:hypothetical protein